MSKKIFKYPIDPSQIENQIKINKYGKILSAGIDPKGDLCLWVLVNPDEERMILKNVYIFGTGHSIPEDYFANTNFIGTVRMGMFVWHIFADQ